MKPRSLIAAIVILIFSLFAFANEKTVDQLANQAASEDYPAAMTAVRELRTMGPVGLDALFVKYAAEIEQFAKTSEPTDEWRRIANALDAVAMQKDSYASNLYWYTNLDEAKRVAKVKNKPILTLRLLGNLNEEFSCANSRLFRAVLYPNADISKYLRENYVLHWQSVRPAPRITIDFGDGRKIERTITGNSIHYILDKDGKLIDALPGLYSPLAFLKYLQQAAEMNTVLVGLPASRHALALMKYRKMSFDQIKQKREKAVAVSGVKMTETAIPPGTNAIVAGVAAATKMVVVDEYSILRVYDNFAKFEPSVNFNDWNKLASLYSPKLDLDKNSIAFIRRQNAKTGLTEEELKGMFAKLDSFIALDTTRNDFLFHTKLYEWLNEGRGVNSLEGFNAKVYDELFQTPNHDKWLGLHSTDVYTALDGNGIIK